MKRARAYGPPSALRRPLGSVRPKDVLAWWQEAHGWLTPAHRKRFLAHPATMELCQFSGLVAKDAVRADKKLDAALERARRARRPQAASAPAEQGAAARRRDQPVARSSWEGGDVNDPVAEERRAQERRLARPQVDRPEPYL